VNITAIWIIASKFQVTRKTTASVEQRSFPLSWWRSLPPQARFTLQISAI